MPLVAHYPLPTFARLRAEGQTILPPDRATRQHIRQLHIGLLNMMPDAALEATERQFFRLVGECNEVAQFYMYPFTLKELPRGQEAQEHIRRFYRPLEKIRRDGLDALIITGANITQPILEAEPFWKPLEKVVEWARDNVTSTLCSCLASHAVLQFRHRQERQLLPAKRWGVFRHHVVDRRHPLVSDVDTRFDVPHSRFNDVSREQFESAGLTVLVESEEAGVHMAVSKDLFRVIFLQGHPEYDSNSLFKEYKREVHRFAYGERNYPPFPTNYLGPQAEAILNEYRRDLEERRTEWEHAGIAPENRTIPALPEALIEPGLDNTWHDTAEAVINNWIGKIYQLTHNDRNRPFMDGVDPEDPLGLTPEKA